ncbi:MAG: hypothetical protein NTW13_00970 [Candidatus Omnitrophica bacterium]|nr:hypothetical protein [Candidatus Omnitrophota bacterium]
MCLENEPMNVPSVMVNLVDVFVIMRRYNINGKIKRAVGELVETTGMSGKTVLMSFLWSYDLSTFSFHESSVSSEYRNRLSQISGKSTHEIMEELKVHTSLISILLRNNIKGIKEVTTFCRNYAKDPQAALETLGVKGQDLIKP